LGKRGGTLFGGGKKRGGPPRGLSKNLVGRGGGGRGERYPGPAWVFFSTLGAKGGPPPARGFFPGGGVKMRGRRGGNFIKPQPGLFFLFPRVKFFPFFFGPKKPFPIFFYSKKKKRGFREKKKTPPGPAFFFRGKPGGAPPPRALVRGGGGGTLFQKPFFFLNRPRVSPPKKAFLGAPKNIFFVFPLFVSIKSAPKNFANFFLLWGGPGELGFLGFSKF